MPLAPAVYPAFSIIICGVIAAALATWIAGIAARRGFPLPEGTNRLGCIDGLRGYLAFAVFVHHFSIWVNVTRFGAEWGMPPSNVLESLGSGGVSLFFATTGLVFYPRVLAGLRRTDWTRVYISRLFRILPLTIVSIALVLAFLVANGLASEGLHVRALGLWIVGYLEPPLLGYDRSYRINAYVLWSLWYEWVFYFAILPVLALASDLSGRSRFGWIVPCLFLAVALIVQRRFLLGRLSLFLPMFAVGMIAYEIRMREPLRRILSHPGCTLPAMASLLGAMAIGPSLPGFVVIGLYGLFFTAVACGNSLFGMLMTRGVRVLGECSFSIYLMHGLVLSTLFVAAGPLADRIDLRWLPAMLVPLAILLTGVTMATFLLVERPFVRYGSLAVANWASAWRGRR